MLANLIGLFFLGVPSSAPSSSGERYYMQATDRAATNAINASQVGVPRDEFIIKYAFASCNLVRYSSGTVSKLTYA